MSMALARLTSWHLWSFKILSVVQSVLVMLAPAHFFLPVPVLMLLQVPVPFYHRVRGFGAAYILALLEFQDPVAGVACARLAHRVRGVDAALHPGTFTGLKILSLGSSLRHRS